MPDQLLLSDYDETTVEALVERVEGIRKYSGCSFDEALRIVHREILGSDRIGEWWELLGVRGLRSTVRSEVATERGRRSGPHRRSNGPPPPVTRPSWREELRRDPELVWEIELPIPGTDERKRIGDFTREDVLQVAEFYQDQADKMLFRKEYWIRIGDKMRPEDTIETAAEAGRIRRNELAFMGGSTPDLATAEMLRDGGDEEGEAV